MDSQHITAVKHSISVRRGSSNFILLELVCNSYSNAEPLKNTAAFIRARLLSRAQSKGEDYQRMLGRYAIERFLYRLAPRPLLEIRD